ncbi:MAG TPA: CehA/McbA family metallohydrolase [Bacteroidales bacterium]|nr:CehA/McbA family metallohydrolase [Bacteroidales bacterium]
MTYIKNSRRNFLKTVTTTSVLSASSIPSIAAAISGNSSGSEQAQTTGLSNGNSNARPDLYDGPQSPFFETIPFNGNGTVDLLNGSLTGRMADAFKHAPVGKGIAWGISFQISENPIIIKDVPFHLQFAPLKTKWLVFLHTSDSIELKNDTGILKKPYKGLGQLNETVADYVIIYDDETEERVSVKERYHIGMYRQSWGENNVLSVAHHKPVTIRSHHEQTTWDWGGSQTRTNAMDRYDWINWLWAWENPFPSKRITGIRFEPRNLTAVVISAISTGMVSSHPLRWQVRRKAFFALSKNENFEYELDKHGLLSQIQLDLGQVISASPRLLYSNETWTESYNNKVPEKSPNEILVEYSAHPEAHFHLKDGRLIPLSGLQEETAINQIKPVPSATHRVKFRIIEKGTSRPIVVKLHVHGESGEYLAPEDRHRIPNNAWFSDYSVDYIHNGLHICTYVDGETQIKLPLGKVYLEVSKGFEIKPVRKIITIAEDTETVEIEIEKVLSWREKGWVSADTHVHFLSPNSVLLEGSGEGVNIVNLLASQWGELFTNIGDFDGKTTFGSPEQGGEGEYLVRVGTENRQHVMGHISLLGYKGNIIRPITTGGPDESALGDPVEMLLTEWAEQCKKQDGLVILPHFPDPRLENAATIVSGNVDGVEMTSWGDLYSGISPYSLADWYRYLNCGYFVAAVGGTDKMSSDTAVGTVRTYARISQDREFSYDEWKEAVRRGETFVTYGPLMNFMVDGNPMGSRIKLSPNGGTVDIEWEVASVTIPISRVELIVNGEVTESLSVDPSQAAGTWRVKVNKSSWYALLVRGHYPDKPEIITAHSSPVMIIVEGSRIHSPADAVTILEQIEGALAYLDSIGTRAEDKIYKRMRLLLESHHRSVHNQMHLQGHYHRHTPPTDHPEHHA